VYWEQSTRFPRDQAKHAYHSSFSSPPWLASTNYLVAGIESHRQAQCLAKRHQIDLSKESARFELK